ncbi:MAG: hypothetical protein SynsKO_44600 [Synoicihabitans sp.]
MIAWLRQHWWWVLAGVVSFTKISFLRSQHIYAIGGARHDDALFANLAAQIVRGNWLGPYDQLTLSKGPAYPIFIAMNFWAGLPLALTQQLLYVVACFVVVWALAPIVKAGWVRFLIVIFLVLNPFTYEGENMTRLLRQHLTVPLALIVVAGVMAILLRRRDEWANRWPWALLTGGALGVFFLSREEGIWIMPLLVVGAVTLGVDAWKGGWLERCRWAIVVGLVSLTAWAPIMAISLKNERHYGWYGTVDFRAEEFQELVGALTRVTVGPERPYVQVSREAREAIYEVSPAFAELRPHLEEGPATAWVEKQKYPAEERQYMTGWFNWALRDAMANAGKMETPRAFLDYCSQIAREVNEACDAGKLPAVGPRSGFMPRWHPEYAVAMKREWKRFLGEALQLEGFVTIVPSSIGTDDDIRAFVDLSYDNLSPSHNATYFHKPDQLDLNRFKLDSLRDFGLWIKGKYQTIFLLAAALLVARLLECAVRRKWSWLAWMSLLVTGAAMSSLAVNFLVHTMAFEYFYPAVFATAYPLLQFAALLAIIDVGQAWARPALQWAWRRGMDRWNRRKSTEPAKA